MFSEPNYLESHLEIEVQDLPQPQQPQLPPLPQHPLPFILTIDYIIIIASLLIVYTNLILQINSYSTINMELYLQSFLCLCVLITLIMIGK